MNHRYRIGLFCIVICSIIILNVSYDYTYQKTRERAIQEETQDTKSETPTLLVDGIAEKSDSGYYLGTKDGYIQVYYSDKKTLFQNTTIKLVELPEDLQEEIHNLKYMKDQNELYGFLENYSS